MSKALRELQARKAKQVAALQAINDEAVAESRELSAEEQTAYSAGEAALRGTNQAIVRTTALIAEETQIDRVPEQLVARIAATDLQAEQDPKRGFRSFGEYAQAVRASVKGRIDPRLAAIEAAAPTTYGSEGLGQDGGFAVPPQYSTDIYTLALTEDSLIPLTDRTPISSNSMVFPKDETTPWGTDGVRAYWQAEAAAATQTKPKLGTNTLRLNKLMALVPLTDELLADAPALGAYLTPLMARSIRWKTNEGILFGPGNGQPQGAFAGGAAIVQAKDLGQATKTVTIGNITNMVARLPPGMYNGAIWLVTPDALPALFQLTLGNYPIYLPIGGGVGAVQGGAGVAQNVQGGPIGMLFGRPLFPSQHAAAFSAQGDLLLANLSWYRTIENSDGVQTATSMHLYFDADATAYRVTFRIDGSSKIAAPISQAKGTNTLSPFIQLASR
ncbi:MAG TPA: phage major capsid protein [Steroidobacteraceae bacterium]|jgi:HK97 family phage major capsid protein